MMRFLRPFFACTCVYGFAVFVSPAALAQGVTSVGLVTDVVGNVRLIRGREITKAGVPADVFPDTRLEIDNGGRVVMLVLASGEEATVKGPASASMSASAVVANPASALTRRTSSVGNVKLRRRDLSQAAIVMRSSDQTVRFPLLNLAGTLTLELAPVFRWTAVEGAGPYRFTLLDDAGRELFTTRTEATEMALPSSVTLAESRVYTWEVVTRRANGLEYSNFGDFALAPSALRDEAVRLRPKEDASFSDRVAYAVWLDSVDLSDAAREVWRRLSRERPDEERLRQLAGP